MTIVAKVGSFTIDTSKTVGQTQSITDLGFEPETTIFFWNGATATGVFANSYSIGLGVALDSTHRFANATASRDEGISPFSNDHVNTQYDTEIVRIYPSGVSSTTPNGILDFYSTSEDGFTVIYDDPFTYPFKVSYIGLGGTDITNTYVGNKLIPNVAGSYTVSGIGFRPDAIIFVSNYHEINLSYSAYISMSLGICDGDLNQGTACIQQQTGTYTRPISYTVSGRVLAGIVGTLTRCTENVTSINDDGFTLYHTGGGSTTRYMQFLALKGGRYKVGNFNTRLDYDDIVETVGFRPVALLLLSINAPVCSGTTFRNNIGMSIGAATSSTERVAVGIWDEYDANPAETSLIRYEDEAYVSVKNDDLQGLLDIKSIGSTSFTAITDYIEYPSGCFITYLAIGYEEPPLPISRVGRATVIMI